MFATSFLMSGRFTTSNFHDTAVSNFMEWKPIYVAPYLHIMWPCKLVTYNGAAFKIVEDLNKTSRT